MRKYCKAYTLGDLRQYSHWQECRVKENEPDFTDNTIVYLWDDFTVVESPVSEQRNIFNNVTPEWQEFCKQTLQFAILENLQYTYQPE